MLGKDNEIMDKIREESQEYFLGLESGEINAELSEEENASETSSHFSIKGNNGLIGWFVI